MDQGLAPQEFTVPESEIDDTFPLPPSRAESDHNFRLVRGVKMLGRMATSRSFRRMRFHGYDSVDEVFESPEIQKISPDDAQTMRRQLAQAIANRKGYNPGIVDEDEAIRPRMSADKLSITATASLLKELQVIFSYNKHDKKIAPDLYRETASRAIRKILNTPNIRHTHQSDISGEAVEKRGWDEELDPLNIKALRKEIVNLAIEEGGNKQTEMSVLRGAGIFHIHAPLIAAYLGISTPEWVGRLNGENNAVPDSVIDKLDFLLRLDVETADRKDVTFGGVLGESALDLLKPNQTAAVDQTHSGTFVATRLNQYKQDLKNGLYKSDLVDSPESVQRYRRQPRATGSAQIERSSDAEISLKNKPETRVSSATRAIVKSLGRLTIRYSGIPSLIDVVHRQLHPGIAEPTTYIDLPEHRTKSKDSRKNRK